MKKCSKCGIEKSLTEFYKDSKNKKKYRSTCKKCNSIYLQENKERKKLYDQEYRNREKTINRTKKYLSNPDVKKKKSEQRKNRRKKNPEKFRKQESESYARRKHKEPGCVYKITNTKNNTTYIGETIRGKMRWASHLTKLRNQTHKNYKLQQDFNEHGEEAFEWSIIKEFPKDKDILLLEEAREIQRRIIDGEQLYNLMLTIEQLKMLNENQEEK